MLRCIYGIGKRVQWRRALAIFLLLSYARKLISVDYNTFIVASLSTSTICARVNCFADRPSHLTIVPCSNVCARARVQAHARSPITALPFVNTKTFFAFESQSVFVVCGRTYVNAAAAATITASTQRQWNKKKTNAWLFIRAASIILFLLIAFVNY